MVPRIIVYVLMGVAWAVGFFVGGSHEWGWRAACLLGLSEFAIDVWKRGGWD